MQYTETITVFKMSSEVIKCPTIGAASFGQSPYIARHLPVQGVVGRNIDRRITRKISYMQILTMHALLYICEYHKSPAAMNGEESSLLLAQAFCSGFCVIVWRRDYDCGKFRHNIRID